MLSKSAMADLMEVSQMSLPSIPPESVPVVITLTEAIVKFVNANGDKDKELNALMDTADRLADELERRKFGNG